MAVFVATGCDLIASGTDLDQSGATATVKSIIDGDSLWVVRGGSTLEVRLFGLNAPERNECLGDEAKASIEDIVGLTVTMLDHGTDQFGRTLATLSVDGSDLATRQLRSGMGIIYGRGEVPGHMIEAERDARAAEIGIWSPEACGRGPLPTLRITRIAGNPPGPDEEHLNEESVTIANTGSIEVDLTGMVIRDESSSNRFFFPDGTRLAPGMEVTVVSGCEPPPGQLGWCSDTPIWNNSGDSALLLDIGGRIIDHKAWNG